MGESPVRRETKVDWIEKWLSESEPNKNYASDDKRAGNVEDSNCSEFVNDSAAAVALSALDMIHFE